MKVYYKKDDYHKYYIIADEETDKCYYVSTNEYVFCNLLTASHIGELTYSKIDRYAIKQGYTLLYLLNPNDDNYILEEPETTTSFDKEFISDIDSTINSASYLIYDFRISKTIMKLLYLKAAISARDAKI